MFQIFPSCLTEQNLGHFTFDLSLFEDVRYLPQESNLTFETATALVKAGREEVDSVQIAEMLNRLGLAEFAEAGARGGVPLVGAGGGVSGGEARRIALARTLLGLDGSLLVLDEPTTGVGAAHRPTVWQLIRSVAENNLVFVVTHDADAPVLPGDAVLEIGPS